MCFNLLAIILSSLTALLTVHWAYFRVLKIAKDKNLVDNPDARKLQKEPVPMMGGIAVFIGVLAGVLIGIACFTIPSIAHHTEIPNTIKQLTPIVCAMSIMLYTGAMDDILGLTPRSRLIIEIATVCGLILGSGMCIDSLHGLWNVNVISWYIAVPLTIFACVGIINAVNMVDGVNGLSSGLCMTIFIYYGITFIKVGDTANAILSISTAGALLPFLVHNIFGKSTKMFIGDAGTMMMGVLMCWLTICLLNGRCVFEENPDYQGVGFVALALAIVSLPVFDTLRVMSMRIARGKSPFHPDKTHLHHAFIKVGISHIATTLTEIFIDMLVVIIWAISVKVFKADFTQQLYVVIVSSAVLIWGSYIFLTSPKMQSTRVIRLLKDFSPSTHWGHRQWWTNLATWLDAPEKKLANRDNSKKMLKFRTDNMLTDKDIRQITEHGLTVKQISEQKHLFRTGFPFLEIIAPAQLGTHIINPTDEERERLINVWHTYKNGRRKIVKFVPASGAATRMFKDLYAFRDADYDTPQTDFEKKFFGELKNMPFDVQSEGNSDFKPFISKFIERYANLPKGLLPFHKYDDGTRTAMEEHLVEASMYATTNGQAKVHFTVSHEHIELFKKKVKEVVGKYEERFGVKYDITFSEQKPSTDTIAVNPDNTLFRNEDESLLFRPAGHGALIENLNDIDADVVFIKNIDNVVPDRLKDETVRYKELLAGVLVETQKRVFGYINQLENHPDMALDEIADFVEHTLCTHSEEPVTREYLMAKLNRPIRVCGMVKNVGEPGGGPFVAKNPDGTTSLQILESSQIDKSNAEYVEMFRNGTHFNPVDLVCSLRDNNGNHFNLSRFVDPQTGFISTKSSNGRQLKALELPGLWNGAMSNWNTVFVEVPIGTFNPVKTINDLAREQHR